MTLISEEFRRWASLVDLSAIANPHDKVAECEYFLELASHESNVSQFRWLISAFLNSAYSFFEISALAAFLALTDPQTGETVEDSAALDTLARYVAISRNRKKPMYVKTSGTHTVTKQLYEFRRRNTHYFPMSIMAAGASLPEDFHFGHITGTGEPALAFCRTAMALISQVQHELKA